MTKQDNGDKQSWSSCRKSIQGTGGWLDVYNDVLNVTQRKLKRMDNHEGLVDPDAKNEQKNKFRKNKHFIQENYKKAHTK